MTGIVFTQLLEMIEDKYGYALVDQILTQSDLPSGGTYTSGGLYDQAELMTLINKLSQETSIPVPSLLYTFGQYMFTYFTKDRQDLLNKYDSAFSLLNSVERLIHVGVRKLYPQAELPHLKINQLSQNHLTLLYSSNQKLSDFAHGLIDGCFDYYNEKVTIVKTNTMEDGSEVLFDIIKES